jgi:hypothetical protein
MEAEYITSCKAPKEVIWIINFVSELVVVPSASSPMDLYYDNSGAIAQAKEPRSHKKSKHVLQCYHLILAIINQDDVKVCKVHTNQYVVDSLTKPPPQPKHEAMCIRYLHE